MHQRACVCEDAQCPGDGGGYFVTVLDGTRVGWLLGPYDTHEDALANVERGNALASAADARAHWYAFGTARVKGGRLPSAVFGR